MTKNERMALKRARKMIAAGEVLFICWALDQAAEEDQDLSEARENLRAYIRSALGGATSLGEWQEARGMKRTPDQRRRDRLAWIDWMLGKEPG